MTGARRALTIVLVAALGLAVVAVLLAALQGVDQVAPGFASFFAGIGGTDTALASTARTMTPILLIAVSASVSIRAGLFDVGQVGQYVIGGLAAATAGTVLPGPGVVVAVASLLIGALAGGAWACAIGGLAVATRVQLVVLTLIANYFADGLARFITRTTLQDPDAHSIVATRMIAQDAWLPVLVPRTSLHLGFVIAIVVTAVVWAIVRYTVAGHRLTMYGRNPKFATLSGVDSRRYPLTVLLGSGSITGLAGAIEVFGVYHRFQDGTLGGPSSVAWTGLTAAILIPSGLLIMLPAALFLAALTTGLVGVQRDIGITAGMGTLVQGVLIVIAAVVLTRRAPRARGGTDRPPPTPPPSPEPAMSTAKGES